jgi:Cdc6-like AAA superfamily ATPase
MSAGSKIFVDREKETERIIGLLKTGDVMILGLAGIGKSAIIQKISEKITVNYPNTALIKINVPINTYPNWLSDRLIEKIYQQIAVDKKLAIKTKEWFVKNAPTLWEIIKTVIESTNSQIPVNIPSIPNVPIVNDIQAEAKNAIFALLDQYIKLSNKKLYIIIEDVHSLVNSERDFLTDLIANHPSNINLLISRRTQEKSATLFSSPEINYLLKDNRVVELHGLDPNSAGLLLNSYGVNYELLIC